MSSAPLPRALVLALLAFAAAIPLRAEDPGATGTTAAAPAAAAEPEWLTGTAQGTPLPILDADDEQVRKLVAWYGDAGGEFRWRIRKKGEQDRVRIWQLEVESAVKIGVEENDWIRGYFYEPLTPAQGKRPAAVVLHHLGGEFTAEEMLAKMLAENGIVTTFMYFPYYDKRWPKDRGPAPGIISEDMDHVLQAFRQSVLDAHRLGDWLLSRPEVDPQRLGLTGISLGAVVGALAVGVDPRFQKVALVMAGGDLTSILLKNGEMVDVKKKLQERGLTPEFLREKLRPIEPLSFAHRVNGANVLLLNATDDEIIPKDCTRALWREMGKPKMKWYKGGHYSLGIYVVDVIQQVARSLVSPVLPRGARATEEETSVAPTGDGKE